MPNIGLETRTQHTGPTGNPDTFNSTTLYAAGQLGQVLTTTTGRYQCVQDDSGNTAGNVVGVVAANQVAFWKDPKSYLVTNDLRFAQQGRNGVAGVFRTAVTAGNFCYVLQSGDSVLVKSSVGIATDNLIANSGTSADVTNVAAGTQLTYASIGIATAANTGGNIAVDLNVPSAP